MSANVYPCCCFLCVVTVATAFYQITVWQPPCTLASLFRCANVRLVVQPCRFWGLLKRIFAHKSRFFFF